MAVYGCLWLSMAVYGPLVCTAGRRCAGRKPSKCIGMNAGDRHVSSRNPCGLVIIWTGFNQRPTAVVDLCSQASSVDSPPASRCDGQFEAAKSRERDGWPPVWPPLLIILGPLSLRENASAASCGPCIAASHEQGLPDHPPSRRVTFRAVRS